MESRTIFTIARQCGSGGHEIGKKLAEELNIPFYDKELIALSAKESGISESVFEKADEKLTGSLLYSLLMGSFPFGSAASPVSGMPVNDMLFLVQSDIIKKAAQAGSCVIVGRCADFVLQNMNHVFNVFIHADKLSRMERVVQEYHVDAEKAADFLTKIDKQRANYCNFYTNRKWGDLENYHLTIDASATGIGGAVELIQAAAAMKENM